MQIAWEQDGSYVQMEVVHHQFHHVQAQMGVLQVYSVAMENVQLSNVL